MPIRRSPQAPPRRLRANRRRAASASRPAQRLFPTRDPVYGDRGRASGTALKVSMSAPAKPAADHFILAARSVFALALIFTLVMALLPHPPKLEFDNFGDKFHHILAFVTLSILACLAFPTARLPQIGERLSFLGAL